LGGGLGTVKEEGEGFIMFSKEITKGNDDRTEYMVICGVQNGRTNLVYEDWVEGYVL
jgi:predicted metallo-beta-lactamase superfamily hydrolase